LIRCIIYIVVFTAFALKRLPLVRALFFVLLDWCRSIGFICRFPCVWLLCCCLCQWECMISQSLDSPRNKSFRNIEMLQLVFQLTDLTINIFQGLIHFHGKRWFKLVTELSLGKHCDRKELLCKLSDVKSVPRSIFHLRGCPMGDMS
jgi:hypothetical protein